MLFPPPPLDFYGAACVLQTFHDMCERSSSTKRFNALLASDQPLPQMLDVDALALLLTVFIHVRAAAPRDHELHLLRFSDFFEKTSVRGQVYVRELATMGMRDAFPGLQCGGFVRPATDVLRRIVAQPPEFATIRLAQLLYVTLVFSHREWTACIRRCCSNRSVYVDMWISPSVCTALGTKYATMCEDASFMWRQTLSARLGGVPPAQQQWYTYVNQQRFPPCPNAVIVVPFELCGKRVDSLLHVYQCTPRNIFAGPSDFPEMHGIKTDTLGLYSLVRDALLFATFLSVSLDRRFARDELSGHRPARRETLAPATRANAAADSHQQQSAPEPSAGTLIFLTDAEYDNNDGDTSSGSSESS